MKDPKSLYDKIAEANAYIREKTDFLPHYGLVLGTGLGIMVEEMERFVQIAYSDIPYFPKSTVRSHEGIMIFGKIGGQNVVVLSGRWHYYEGYSTQEITFPIRVMKSLGVKELILTNAGGSVNSSMQPGDIVFIEDHINLMPENPLRGENDERLGVRFPDMKNAYNIEGNRKAMNIGHMLGYSVHSGVYVGLQGPNLETPAEYRFLHRIGGDLVGMSTVPEVLVAVHSGLKPLVASIISNCAYPIAAINETTLQDVISTVNHSAWKLKEILIRYLKDM